MCRETCSDDDNLGVVDICRIARKIVLGQGDVEVRTAVRVLRRQTLGLRSALVIVRGIESFDAILGFELYIGGVIRVGVRTSDKDGTIGE